MAQVQLPAEMIPSWRTQMALDRKIEKNILFHTFGGLGDTVCAEPALRFALQNFKDCKISLATEFPELFTHLKFETVFDLKVDVPFWKDYLVFNTIEPCGHLTWEFMSHLYVNCVDYCSLCAYRSQVPVVYRPVILPDPFLEDINQSLRDFGTELLRPGDRHVLVHAGKHWPSKTFPKDWWDKVLEHMIECHLTPVLIGKELASHQGTVAVDTKLCIDLRGKTTLIETIWLLKLAKVLLCNDSAPLHIAASGDAWIIYVATCKHPDFITHWRRSSHNGQAAWGWRMKNLGLGGMWDYMDVCPNKAETTKVDALDEKILRTFLPAPEVVAQTCQEKINEYR